LTNDTKVRLYISDSANMGSVADIQEVLVDNKITRITHSGDKS